MINNINIWNIKLSINSLSDIMSAIDSFLQSGNKGFHISPATSYVINLAQEDEEQRQSLLESDIVSVDSFLPYLALKVKGVKNVHKVPGPDIMDAILDYSNLHGRSVYFLGAKQSTLDILISLIRQTYPNLVVAGSHNGYFTDDEQDEVSQIIRATLPDFLLIALPSPKKERFIKRYKRTINAGCLFGVGGAFDAKAGVLKRPSKWLRHFGMEGIFRMLRRPDLYGKRMLIDIKWFFHAIIHD